PRKGRADGVRLPPPESERRRPRCSPAGAVSLPKGGLSTPGEQSARPSTASLRPRRRGPGHRQSRVMHPVILIAGASGGLGASTLAVATATVLSGGAPGVLVDAGFGSGGLDVTLAAEHAEGLRWGDLAEHEGEADGSALRAALPMGPVPVLAARGPRPGARTISDVV